MKNIILVVSHKNSVRSEYFFNSLCSHKNIQKINFKNYDKIEKFFQIKNIRNDYLKSPKFYCENITYNHQLSFKPFLNQLIYFFIIEKPRNIITNKEEGNHYCLRLRRIYEILCKSKNKMIFFDNEVYQEETYKKCFSFLKLNDKIKNKKQNPQEVKGFFDQESEDFYEKYRYKIVNNFMNN